MAIKKWQKRQSCCTDLFSFYRIVQSKRCATLLATSYKLQIKILPATELPLSSSSSRENGTNLTQSKVENGWIGYSHFSQAVIGKLLSLTIFFVFYNFFNSLWFCSFSHSSIFFCLKSNVTALAQRKPISFYMLWLGFECIMAALKYG